MPKTYKAIFIDWDDTIGDWSSAAYEAQRELYERYRIDRICPSFEEWFNIYHDHNNLLWERYGRSEITKEYLQRDRFLTPLLQLTGNDKPTPQQTKQADRMGLDFLDLTNHHFRLLPDAALVVRYLAERYPLTVVSNGFAEVQYYKLMHSGLRDCFSHVILSEEVGVQKPDPAIFRKAIQCNNDRLTSYGEAALTEKDVLMIGDGYGSDIEGAKAAGIDRIWICRDEAQYNDPALKATHKIRSLKELMTML